MYRHVPAHPCGFVHRSFQLRLRVLIWGREFSIPQRIRPSLIDLDEVGAFLELLPDHRNQFVRAVSVIRVGKDVLLGVIADGVFVSAKDVDCVAANPQPRPGNAAFINRIPHRRVG